ncbi:sugar phosphate isomerase/epimerase family protein [Gorillibacterium sp. sgz5001074]|uniref:sugar phosphate isomerase/epimerase family protein n=1 Tax=Gorillibacterium sp. sgz5001074 TaxID=3446695 RepID=UPI003F668A5C
MRRMGIALQLYTLRDAMAEDFEGTLRRVAAMGYEGVEFAGYGGMPAEALKALLLELNLKAVGAHVSLAAIKSDLQAEIAYLKGIGAKYLICPWLNIQDFQSEVSWKELFALFAEAGQACAKERLVFCYHNHAFEFEHKVDGEFVFDAMYQATPADAVQVEMDAGWVQYAGQDTLGYMARYAGRLPLVHLKDYNGTTPEGQINTLELGRGVLPLEDILRAASDAGAEWIIVEQDRCENPPLACVETSLVWLKSHYLQSI